MIDARCFPAHSQFHRCHGRLVTRPIFLTQRVIGHTDGVFTCGKSGKITVFKRHGSVSGHRVAAAVNACVPVIQRRHGIAVKADTEGNIRAVKLRKADCLGDRLGIGVDHHAVGIDNGNVAAHICHAEIDIRFSARLNIEGRRALCERQLRPVAGNRVLILKCGLGKQIFRLGKAAARIGCGHGHGLGFLKEQAEGDRVHKGAELIGADCDFRRRRSNIRHTLHGDGHAAAHAGEQEGVAGFVTHNAVHRRAVYKNSVASGLGIALCNVHLECIVGAVTCRIRTGGGKARAARQHNAV